ncbi:MAG: M3 family metallopeptidase [Micavibrio aeruginosavorus]|uniref:M3 family metallopeptidase n=1 Tax=Micavibrio aeruginosavorus TaxID=349221 RepID=A0A7T5R3M2_9BACT|nr:MAG: M3 family metallopeptidase [Micavibrio aeruginosavorus]
MASVNPLLAHSTLPNQAPVFDKIKDKHFLPAMRAALKEARAEIRAIKTNPEQPTFTNTIEAFELAGERLGILSSLLSNQMLAAGTPELKAAEDKISPLRAKFSMAAFTDIGMFKRVKTVWDLQHNDPALTTEQRTLLKKTYDGFRNGGALLKGAAKKRLKDIVEEMSTLGSDFSENVKKDVEVFALIVTDKDDMKGLPEDAIAAAAEEAKARGLENRWVFTLDYPSYGPFMTYADNRDLREQMWRAYGSRGWKTANDNQDLIRRIVTLSHEKAQLLGYKNHAAAVLEDRMAQTPETVARFLEQLRNAYKPAALKDLESLKAFAASRGQDDLKPWDVNYYSEKQQQELYGFSSEDLKPYFPLEKVLGGAFDHFSRQFGLEFAENRQYPTWHEDVKAFDVTDRQTGEFVGTLYTDFHPRKGKKGGAWMTDYRAQGLYQGRIERPVVAIECNFTKPLPDKPALLDHGEVTTLFHELGHALHGLLSDVTYRSKASPYVPWDCVELPSQVQENWAYQRETLALISGHYQTGEKIPEDLYQKLIAAKNYMAGYAGLRQVNLATLDQAWYNTDPKEIEEKFGFDVLAFEKAATEDTRLFPMLAGPTSTSFTHIFAGGYDAGYYSYKWAEVLDADAFEYLTELDTYDTYRLDKYRREFLAKGGTDNPATLYRNFRGQDADPEALPRREGLLPPKPTFF